MNERGVEVSEVSATGQAVSGSAKVYGLSLVPDGTNACDAVVRQVDGSGGVKARLAAPGAGPADFQHFDPPVAFKDAVHVTLTGSGATLLVYHRPTPG